MCFLGVLDSYSSKTPFQEKLNWKMEQNTMGCSTHADMPNNNENIASHKSSSHGWVHVNKQESTNN